VATDIKTSVPSMPRIGWTTVAVLLVGLNLRPAITALAPVLSDIELDEGLSAAAAGMLTSMPLLVFVLLSTSAPRFGRRLGYGRAILAALFILLIGTGVRLLPGTSALFAGMAVVGVAITIGNVLLPAYIKQRYAAHAGRLSAVYTASLFLGPAFAAAGTLPLMNLLGSWRLAIASWGVLALIAIPFWRPHAIAPDAAALAQPDKPQGSALASRSERIWSDPLAWAVTAYFAVLSMMFYTVSAWLPTMLISAGKEATTAGAMLSLVNIVAIPCTLAVTLAVHRFRGQVWATTAGAFLIAMGLIGIYASPGSGLVIWIAILGAGFGVEAGVGFSLPILRTRTAAQTAALAGMAQTAGYAFSALGPVGAGAIHDFMDSWQPILQILIALIVAQGFVGLFAGRDLYVNDAHTVETHHAV
jgi:MFS transporter, CP family, cyanate transporter